jgi:hypothetical protein
MAQYRDQWRALVNTVLNLYNRSTAAYVLLLNLIMVIKILIV